MRVFKAYDEPGIPRGMVLGIGTFDGVHLGHRAVIREVVRRAQARGVTPGLLTFHPHPLEVVGKGGPVPIYTEAEKEEILGTTGVRVLISQRFGKEFASMDTGRFVREVLAAELGPSEVVVGHDFRFGAGRAGDVALLKRAGRENGFEVVAVEEVLAEGVPVRSSRIRELVAEGRVEEAGRLLGRPFSISGVVRPGRKVGRRDLGFPTANMDPPGKLVPPAGVYAGRVRLAEGSYTAAVNISEPRRGGVVECHLLGYDGDLYGETIQVTFYERLRGEREFGDTEALARQISRDIREIRRRGYGNEP